MGQIGVIPRRSVQLAILAALWFLLGTAFGRVTAATPEAPIVPETGWRSVEPATALPEPSRDGSPSDGASSRGAPSQTPAADASGPSATVAASEPDPATPAPAALPGRGTGGLTLSATWYCNADASRGPLSRCTRGYPDRPPCGTPNTCPDLFVAVSPDLAWLRGRTLTVWRGVAGATVRAIDCNCAARGALDLYADAFSGLARLGAGRITVTIGGTPR